MLRNMYKYILKKIQNLLQLFIMSTSLCLDAEDNKIYIIIAHLWPSVGIRLKFCYTRNGWKLLCETDVGEGSSFLNRFLSILFFFSFTDWYPHVTPHLYRSKLSQVDGNGHNITTKSPKSSSFKSTLWGYFISSLYT